MGVGEQNPEQRTPEAGSRPAAYGSAIHDAIAALEEGRDDAQAVQDAWDAWGHRLHPEDLQLLREDIENFRHRDFENVRTVLAEDEIRVPLMLGDGQLAYFRARIDRLYERLDAPGQYILVDYKSSRWPKTEAAVGGEPDEETGEVDAAAYQLAAYDWVVREYLPEIDDLVLIYDQLRYGQIQVRKSDEQRRAIRDWLTVQMSSYFGDDRVQADGLLPPRHNQWCAWCPILESCPIIHELSHFALSRIAALGEDLDAPALDGYAEEYAMAKDAAKILERFVKSVNGIVRELPADERARLGFRLTERKNSRLTPQALQLLHERLGPQLLELVSLPKTRLESLPDELQEWALSLMSPAAPTVIVTKKGS